MLWEMKKSEKLCWSYLEIFSRYWYGVCGVYMVYMMCIWCVYIAITMFKLLLWTEFPEFSRCKQCTLICLVYDVYGVCGVYVICSVCVVRVWCMYVPIKMLKLLLYELILQSSVDVHNEHWFVVNNSMRVHCHPCADPIACHTPECVKFVLHIWPIPWKNSEQQRRLLKPRDDREHVS